MTGGVYYLVINLLQDLVIDVGGLGRITLNKGIYVYVGSGKGLGGVYRRISRHFLKNKKSFWHIDYLTTNSQTQVIGAVAVINKTLNESFLSKLLMGDRCFKPAVKGFGCSDIKSDSTHLYMFICEHGVVNHLVRMLMDAEVPMNDVILIDQNCLKS